MKQDYNATEIKEGAVFLVDKPLNWTSFDALNKIRSTIHTKIGHCGTLDPLATGLLICCTAKKTKSITEYQDQTKEYTGTITLGAITPTFDLESEPIDFKSTDHLGETDILAATAQFTGAIQQLPPIHSAIKKDGKKLYELARAGETVIVEPRNVTIYEFEIIKIALPNVEFRVSCSKGTYIRSLANDFGAALNCGGYLSSLRRTKIGEFSVEDAKSVAEWIDYLQPMGFVKEKKIRSKPKPKLQSVSESKEVED